MTIKNIEQSYRKSVVQILALLISLLAFLITGCESSNNSPLGLVQIAQDALMEIESPQSSSLSLKDKKFCSSLISQAKDEMAGNCAGFKTQLQTKLDRRMIVFKDELLLNVFEMAGYYYQMQAYYLLRFVDEKSGKIALNMTVLCGDRTMNIVKVRVAQDPSFDACWIAKLDFTN